MPKGNPQDVTSKNRVHIQYEVAEQGAIKKIELPFVVGVMSDLSGNVRDQLKPADDRQFLEVNNQNFNQVMSDIAPTVSFTVPNTLSSAGGNLGVELTFRSMDDFTPEAIARKVPVLNSLLEKRAHIKDLLNRIGTSQKAQDTLAALIKDGSGPTDT